MTKLLFLWFLLLHVVADFYLQTDELAKKKRESDAGWLIHGLIYGAVMLISLVVFPQLSMVFTVVALTSLHALIDRLKPVLEKRLARSAFLADQALHLTTLLLGAWLIRDVNWLKVTWLGTSAFSGLSLGLGLLLVAKPANLTIKDLLGSFSPTDKVLEQDESLLDGGKVIGTLERVLVLLLLLASQWGAVGIVFAAKSIIRWKNISKDNTEYFLIGTLLSLIFVVATYYLIYII